MGLGLRVFVIMVCIAFLFTFAPRPCSDVEALTNSYCSGFGESSSFITNVTGNPTNMGNFYDNFYGQIVLAAGAAVAISIFFPNPYTIFAAFALFLLAFAKIPYDIFASAASYGVSSSDPLLWFMGSIFGLLLIVAAVTWYKGNEW